jgi:3alpha(or 20beta)-hydroxysteroid dehydrogenase
VSVAGGVAIVTGAARGQGEVEARLLAEHGAGVVVADILDDLGEQVVTDIGPSARYVHLDVRDANDWRDALAAAAELGDLSILVNNAGVYKTGTVEDMSLDDYRFIVDVNQVGTFLGMKSVIPVMKRASRGSIINISSTMGFESLNGTVAYTATKFAIRGMTKTAALELGRHGIRVNSVHPGRVNTTMGSGGDVTAAYDETLVTQAIPRVGEPIEIAKLVLFLASDDSSYCTGAEFVVDGGALCGVVFPQLPGGGQG